MMPNLLNPFTTENEDFLPFNETIVLSTEDNIQSRHISILNDSILEEPESFSIIITTNITSGVSLNPSVATVTIKESSGMKDYTFGYLCSI